MLETIEGCILGACIAHPAILSSVVVAVALDVDNKINQVDLTTKIKRKLKKGLAYLRS